MTSLSALLANPKIIGTGFTATVLYSGLIGASVVIAGNAATLAFYVAVMVLGAAAGWVSGFILSPYDSAEKQTFSSAAQSLAAFGSGYLLSKLDGILESILTTDFLLDMSNGFPVIAFFSAVLITMVTTFALRRYSEDFSAQDTIGTVS